MEKIVLLSVVISVVLMICALIKRSIRLSCLENSFNDLASRYDISKKSLAAAENTLKSAAWESPLRKERDELAHTVSVLQYEIQKLSKQNLLKELSEKEHQLKIAYAEFRQFKHGVEIMLGGKNGTPDR